MGFVLEFPPPPGLGASGVIPTYPNVGIFFQLFFGCFGWMSGWVGPLGGLWVGGFWFGGKVPTPSPEEQA